MVFRCLKRVVRFCCWGVVDRLGVFSLEGLYSRTLAPTVSAIICSALTIAVVGSRAWQLGLVALVGVVSLGIALPLVASSLTRRRAEKLNAYSVLMSSFVLDSLDGIFDLVQCGRARVYAKELETHAGSLEAGERPLGRAVAPRCSRRKC